MRLSFYSFTGDAGVFAGFCESTWEIILPDIDLRAHGLLFHMDPNLR